MTPKVGAVFLVIEDESPRAIKDLLRKAQKLVVPGRCLFVLWESRSEWIPSTPVESISVEVMLQKPHDRGVSGWLFYGNGTVRMYEDLLTAPEKIWMWAGFRLAGPKAYKRMIESGVSQLNMKKSAIPVSDKVFTRDVANNLWHLRNCDGPKRVIKRLQSLTTWSDEVSCVFNADRLEWWDHDKLDCSDDLIPVAEKIDYECEGLNLSLPANLKKKILQKEKLF